MKYRILGPVELAGDSLTGSRQRALLALLLARSGEVVSSEALASDLWGDDQPDDPAGAVRTQVSRLRRAGADIATRPGGYMLVAERDELDAEVFRRLVDEALGAEPARALSRLDDALALWRGRAFGDLAEHESIRAAAVELEELRLDASEDRAELLLVTGAVEDAIRAAEAIITAAPVRERPRALSMRALYAAGRQVEALDAYQAYRKLLTDELGIEPSPELRELERDLLDHRPPGAGPRPLALPVTSFIGREDALATVDALLERARLVTVTGPGGVGKTRLAMHVAARRGALHRDGVAFCDLTPVADDAGVLRALATALAVSEQPGRSLADSIVDAARSRDVLVVLDNCEHVLEPVATLLEALVPRSVDTRILATSRERLAVDGEHVQPLAPLAVSGPGAPAAAQLFLDRARALQPEFEDDPDAIAQLCRRLDGLPLAIELAAALTQALPLRDIVDGLEARFELLRGGRRNNARHRSLEATVDWSYSMLGSEERTLFECCSAFAGWFALDDARAIAAPDVPEAAVAPILARLVERSMVVRASPDRYSLLETLRDYGRTRLAERVSDVRDRHARHFVGVATRADPATIDAQLAELRAAHRWLLARGNTGGALELSGALYRFGFIRSRPEVSEWAALAVDEANPALEHFGAACASAAVGAWQHGDLDAAEDFARRGLDSSYECADVLSDVALFRGDLDEAIAHAEQAARRAAAVGDVGSELLSTVNRALARSYRGDDDEAVRIADELVVRAHAHGGAFERAMAHYTAGECRLEHDPETALVELDVSCEIARDSDNHFVLGIAMLSAASLRARQGDSAGAISRYAELIDHWWEARVWTQQWTTLRTLVELLCLVDEHAAATTLLAAVTHTASTMPFGADAERLTRLADELRTKLGDAPFDLTYAHGEALSAEAVVDFARRTLRRLDR